MEIKIAKRVAAREQYNKKRRKGYMKRLSGKRVLSMILAFLLTITTVFMGNVMEAKAETGEITITVTGDTGMLEEIKINDNSKIQTPGGGLTTGTVNGNTGNGETNTITLSASFGFEFKSIVINSVDYSSAIATSSQKDMIEITNVPASTAYTINVSIGSGTIRTIVWAYDENTFGKDAYVEHGTVRVLSINGVSNTDDQHVVAKKDDKIVVELKPDYGYQIAGVSINGGATLAAQNEVSQFEFIMPDTNIHFRGIFVPKEDEVQNNATAVAADGSIGNGGTIAQTGTVLVKLSNPNTNAGNSVALNNGEELDTSKKIQSLDISTYQMVSKGNGDYWESQKTETQGGNAEIFLTVNQEANGYAVIREHDGEYAEIPSTYDPATKKLIFGSDKFSTYILVPLTAPKNDYTPITTGNGSGNSHAAAKGNAGGAPHAHNFQWTSVMAPSNEQDGLEAYACTICGFYEESVPVSAYSYACTEAAKQVISAKQGAEITLKMGRWCAYPKWFMEKLAERRDLTIKLQFEYLHQQYEVMIPADTKIDTECDWYGPLKICSLYSYSVK